MRAEDEVRLARAALGDTEARRALAVRKSAEPQSAAEIERAERAWEALELPPLAPAPPGFPARTASAAAAERSLLPGFTLSPAWARVAAAFLVVAGVAGGAGLGSYALAAESAGEIAGDVETAVDEPVLWSDEGLLDEQLFEADASSGSTADPSTSPSGPPSGPPSVTPSGAADEVVP